MKIVTKYALTHMPIVHKHVIGKGVMKCSSVINETRMAVSMTVRMIVRNT